MSTLGNSLKFLLFSIERFLFGFQLSNVFRLPRALGSSRNATIPLEDLGVATASGEETSPKESLYKKEE